MAKYKGQIREKLTEYQKLGFKQGGKGDPASEANSLDMHEAKIYADAERYVMDEYSIFKNIEAKDGEELSKVEGELLQLEGDCKSLLEDKDLSLIAEHSMAQNKNELISWKKNVLERESALKSFRALNMITLPADYPESKWETYSWLIGFVVIETIMNAFFYSNSAGYLGGAVVALAVACINLLITCLCGYFYNYKNLKITGWKFFGWGSLLSAIMLALFFNALFATYRTEYEKLSDPLDLIQQGVAFGNALTVASQIFLLNFKIDNFLSFILFFLGIVFSAIAFYKGHSADDKYPGHGNLDRLYKNSLSNFELVNKKVKESINNEVERKRTQFSSVKNKMQSVPIHINKLITSIENSHRNFILISKQIQDDLGLIQKTYREANISVRSTKAPNYFSEFSDVSKNYKNEDTSLYKGLADTLNEKANFLRSEYLNLITEKLSSYTEEGKEILGNRYNNFLLDITNEAKDQINHEKILMPT